MKITKLPNGGALCEFADGDKHWYLNMNLVIFHREDDPAWEGNDGSKEWWINGELLQQMVVSKWQTSPRRWSRF
jgi:hypothetical protein